VHLPEDVRAGAYSDVVLVWHSASPEAPGLGPEHRRL